MKKLLVLVAALGFLLVLAAQPMMAAKPDRTHHAVMVQFGDQYVSAMIEVSGDVWIDPSGKVKAGNKSDELNVRAALDALKATPADQWKRLPWANNPQAQPEVGSVIISKPGGTTCTTSMKKMYRSPEDGDVICPTNGKSCTVEVCNPN